MAQTKQRADTNGTVAQAKMCHDDMDRVEHCRMKVLAYLDAEERGEAVDSYDLVYWQQQLDNCHQCSDRQTASCTSMTAGKKAPCKAQLYHLRLSLTEKYSVDAFNDMMKRFVKASWVDKHHVVYVLEQGGVDVETRGNNPHAHIRFKSSFTKGRLLYQIKRVTGLDGPAIKLHAHDNVNALRQYMLGNKGDPLKATSAEQREERENKRLKCMQDKCWRIEQGIKVEYSFN